ncbi:MAG: hypothetical protein JWN10_2157 [Solirubrobacterales bacterium]|nr:hypothetical protein [Solirubrobacterales bacterium]
MHADASIALEAFEHGNRAWVRFTPEVVEDLGGDRHLLLDAVDEFESLPTDAGRAATSWLRERALDEYGSSVTYLMLLERQVEAYYALSSAEVLLSGRDRKRALKGRSNSYEVSPRQPASLIAWTAKRNGADACGELILKHAFTSALEVAETQGNIALVLDPYDDETAKMWLRMECVDFRRSAEARPSANGADPVARLWTPLHPAQAHFV